MKKLVYILSALICLSAVSCRNSIEKKINPAKGFPNVASYSPGFAKTGDTISIIGSVLTGSTVEVGGKQIDLTVNTDDKLAFVVTDDVAPISNDGRYSLKVLHSDGDFHEFSMPIVLNHEITLADKAGWLSTSSQAVGEVLETGPAQLLISDFDGGGIREADATDKFDRTQFDNQAQPTGVSYIGSTDLTQGSPLGNNYYILKLDDPGQLGGNGHAGEVWSRSEIMNDRKTEWPVSFFDYVNGPLKEVTTNNEMNDVYLNFLLYKGGAEKTVLYAYLYNDFLPGGEQYRSNFDFELDGASVKVPKGTGLNEWVWVSLPFRDSFKDNFGFGSKLKGENANTINKIKIAFAHGDKLDDQPGTATGGIEAYIDHIIITQGAPYYGHKR